MNEFYAVLIGWALGFAGAILFETVIKNRKRRKTAEIIRTEVEHFKPLLEEELGLLQELDALPSLNSPLYQFDYNNELYEILKPELAFFPSSLIKKITAYYGIIKLINQGKQFLRELINEKAKNNDFIVTFDTEVFYATQQMYREKLLEVTDELIEELKKETRTWIRWLY